MNCQYKNCSNTHLNWGGREVPSRPVFILCCYNSDASSKQSVTHQTHSNGCKLYAATCRPFQLGWVLEQVLYGQFIRLSQRESGYAKLDLLGLGREDWSCCTRSAGTWICSIFLLEDILWFVHKTVNYHHEVNKFVSNSHC